MKYGLAVFAILFASFMSFAQSEADSKVTITVTKDDGTTYTIEAPNMESLEEMLDEIDDSDLENLSELEDLNILMGTNDSTKKDSTSLQVGQWKIIVREKGDGTDDVDISLDKVENEDLEGEEPEEYDLHDVDNFQTEWFLLSLGYNTFVNADYKVDVPAPYEVMEDLHFWGSTDVNLDLFKSRINFGSGFVNFNYGIAFEWHHYRFNNNFSIVPGMDSLTLNTETIDYEKNKLNTTHLCLPLSLGFETKPWDTENSFRIAFGYDPGIRIKAKTKHKVGGEEDIEKDDFNLEDFRQEINASIGYGKFNLYASYDLTSMFKQGEGPELYPVSVGIIIRRGFDE